MAIDTISLMQELVDKGKVKCPLCNQGFFVVDDNTPVEKQKKFVCTHCKEKWLLNIKMPK